MLSLAEETSSRWHSIISPKTEVSSSIFKDKVIVPNLKFSVVVKSVEVRVYDGYDFYFQESHGLEEQVKQSIAMGFDQQNALSDLKNSHELNRPENAEESHPLDFAEIKDFFEDQSESESSVLENNDLSQCRVRQRKRSTKRYFQLMINQIEFTYLNLENTDEGIDSQLGFTIEKVIANEIRSRTQIFKIFFYDNDYDLHKNFGLKVIFLTNKDELLKHEKYMEFYLMSESIKMNASHQSITFAYLLVQPITLFMENELRKDAYLIDEVKNKTSENKIYNSISMEKVEDQKQGDVNSSVWKINDKNLDKRESVYIKYMHIFPFKIRINYTSDNLNVMNLYKGELLSYLSNVVDIKNLKIKIKERKIKDKILLSNVIKKTIEFYLNDLIYNQNLNILASVYPIRVTINILKAFATLVKSPVDSYMNEKYLLIGIYQGFSGFLSQITNEFSDVGSKLLTYISSWKNFINE